MDKDIKKTISFINGFARAELTIKCVIISNKCTTNSYLYFFILYQHGGTIIELAWLKILVCKVGFLMDNNVLLNICNIVNILI